MIKCPSGGIKNRRTLCACKPKNPGSVFAHWPHLFGDPDSLSCICGQYPTNASSYRTTHNLFFNDHIGGDLNPCFLNTFNDIVNVSVLRGQRKNRIKRNNWRNTGPLVGYLAFSVSR